MQQREYCFKIGSRIYQAFAEQTSRHVPMDSLLFYSCFCSRVCLLGRCLLASFLLSCSCLPSWHMRHLTLQIPYTSVTLDISCFQNGGIKVSADTLTNVVEFFLGPSMSRFFSLFSRPQVLQSCQPTERLSDWPQVYNTRSSSKSKLLRRTSMANHLRLFRCLV